MEFRIDLPFWEFNVDQPANVRKTLASVFEEEDGLPEAKLALEQAGLMDDVQARVQFPDCLLIVSGQDQEREIRLIEHALKMVGD
jgi:hypothetical protein